MTNAQLANLIQDYFIALKTFYRERTPSSASILRTLENDLKEWSAKNRPQTDRHGNTTLPEGATPDEL